ncbi:hypothetical protein [Rhizobium sp. SSA_523]|uniref:hypothetical protein n=1 Tax=Rhizobium sp. SSA_523 TaxID=2952477 RepID=UPI0020909BDA|nr:hypothetical protein [Rhizobium sp. SSA_523]MCO5734123.1 hypothetical protein [Rhizobium sp. SSA_523]WKC24760.1 hypothetical protein QTJ18_12090 [Rhizobium sp. SSA_523]
MSTKMVTEPGYYNGKFLKPGMSYVEGQGKGAGDDAVDLASMTKDQLLAEAERRGIDVDRSKTKAEILAVLDEE